MNPQDAGSLDRLRDIVEPAAVSWWPPAVGWWFVFALLAIGLIIVFVKTWKRWNANAYRRAALAELDVASNDAAVVELLKRTAICASDRTEVGSLTGAQWCRWLSRSSATKLSPAVTDRISTGVYRDAEKLTPELVDFARLWISNHSAQLIAAEG